MALLLCLGLTAALARGCLHCHGNFSDKFSFYRHHVNLKSWWVGDIPVSGSLLSDWSQDTMKELHLAIPAEISECGGPARAEHPARPDPGPRRLTRLLLPPSAREKLNQVADAVYQRMDQLYQGKMYFPGRIDCQRHCGIFRYETISCTNCTDSHVVCFGYNCESSAQWETAVQDLLQYINKWHKMDTNTSLISPSFTCLEPPHLANLTLENASECLTQH
ncbi:izumo sperm-egg fusion protein 4 isoform X3 [Moschus berezovskii]|uniref:izumo sperm-egg fusion protein 4 isoform X3 n=1 Tax=Moschus berezovskii TaxID=68408 RepID=UPI0024449910|nr:izumo sperm-egg fusion protein 4 isoform X3 [Moschus berezovskii]